MMMMMMMMMTVVVVLGHQLRGSAGSVIGLHIQSQ